MLVPEIIYENQDFIVVFKPHGLNTETDKYGNSSLESWLVSRLRRKVFLANRLDRPVSGLLVCTKKKTVLNFLQIHWKHFQKKYLALVEGKLEFTDNVLKHYHFKDNQHFRAVISDNPKRGYQDCSLRYRILEQKERFSLIEITLLTGKYHQIRAQMAHIGHPILGDIFYGSKIPLNTEVPTIALCAYQMQFYYPTPREIFHFTYPLKENFWCNIN